ncbi:hypothetical protein BRX36_10605 [Sphingomonas sp. S-NIH.Pt1_0416]|uniref:hypothetical protein n=1 Tax=Sphingomonas sp. S-NIH.Pt1_0416 TaxID=1920123 RepID=UPI000F7F4AAA|nr:hypothetical protein [Sphingomonas sp. S-NIH.Pt1_0416]RSU65486.1 hypothetical protein BRX36_10605 [Sphingomonas sp. S-NIH.Pt1_0416]
MRSKLMLSVRPSHEAARRIAQWVMTLPGGLDEAAEALAMPVDWVQRLVADEMVPGLDAGARLYRLVGITARMFRVPARGGWFDRVPFAQAA